MDDNASTNERRKLVKTYKNVLIQKETVVAEVCGETHSKEKKLRGTLRKRGSRHLNNVLGERF